MRSEEERDLFVRMLDEEEAEEVSVTRVYERQHCRIYYLANGQVAKVVKGSGTGSAVPRSMRERVSAWLARSLMAWTRLTSHIHPGLMRVFDLVQDNEGNHGYACEKLDAIELEDPAHPARTSLRAFLEASINVARAAGVLHRGGIVHGDVTPMNVCWRDGLPVLIDLEMAKGYQDQTLEVDDSLDRIEATPACCSPEQVLQVAITPASDVFCLALTMLSWATGIFGVSRAYWGQTEKQSFELCEHAEYPHWELVRARVLEPSVLCVLERALALVPCDRYANGDEFAQALEDLLASLPPEALAQSLNVSLDELEEGSEMTG